MKTLRTAAMALAIPAMLASALPAQAATSYHTETVSVETWNQHARGDHRDRWDRGERRQQREWGGRQGYDRYQGNYGQRQYRDEPVYRNTRVWRGDDNRYYCRKSNGTTGLIIGGAAGALLGREIAGRGDNTLGAILGGVGGALLGREVDRGGSRCR